MIAFTPHIEAEIQSVYERPGSREVDRAKEETTHRLELLDSPGDLLAEALNCQLSSYRGSLPQSHDELRRFVMNQFHSAAGPTAVSAMIEHFIAEDVTVQTANVVRRMLVLIRSQAKPALTCDALAVALGFHIGEARSFEEIADAHGVTKQALSKRAIRFCTMLGIKPSPLMRSEESRESYRSKQLERHSAARAAGMGTDSLSALKKRLAAARSRKTAEQLRQPALANGSTRSG